MTTPPSTPSDREVCGLVNELAQTLSRHTRTVAEAFELTETQAVALRELAEPLTLRALAARMCCEPSNATFVADRLERMGVLERRPHPSDRRSKQLHLTPEGSRLREKLIAAMSTGSPMQNLDGVEQDLLRNLLLRATTDGGA